MKDYKLINAIERALQKKLNYAYMTCSYLPEISEIATEIYTAIAPLVEAGANKNIEESKTIVVKVAASLVRNQACEYAEDLNLPKTTPITAIRKFEHEARVWNDTNRLRAIELKRAYDLMK